MVWLSGWNYRKSHTLTQKAGAGTNYQVCIKVYKGNGIDGTETIQNGLIAGKIYCGGNCKDDFGDIRFTSSDGETLLDYWMELSSSGEYALFWIEILDNLTSGDVVIYVYYGNNEATSLSNGANTFINYCNFEADSNGWYPYTGETLALSSEAAFEGSKSLKVTGTSSHRAAFMAFITFPLLMANGRTLVYARDVSTNRNVVAYLGSDTTTVTSWSLTRGQASNIPLTTTFVRFITKWLDTDTGSPSGDINGISFAFINSGAVTALMFPYVATPAFYIDAFCLMKYVSGDVVHGAWGEEEEAFYVVTNNATSITINSAVLNGLPSEQCEVRGFDWGLESGVYTDEWYEIGIFNPESYSRTITSLIQGTTYYFRAKVKAIEAEDWVYGEEKSFTTLIRLTIEGKNLSNESLVIDVTVDGIPHETSYSEDFEKNDVVTIIITQSEPFIQSEFRYEFKKWENESTNKTRNVTMTGTSTIIITAYFRKLFELTINSIATGNEFQLNVGGS